ncbi:MAG: ferritin family protein, partial [Planctomycetota bacterium]|jgi:rubrerythrin
MAENFGTVEDVLEFAVFREAQAYQLYMYMAEHATGPEMSKVCESFAKEELAHKAKLKIEVSKIGAVVTDLNVSDYVMAARDPIEMDYAELLVFAMNGEQKSFELYSDLAKRVEDEQSRKLLLSLAQDEVEHKQRFEVEYEKLGEEK